VLARIVKALEEGGSANRTALATSVGLSYDRFMLYFNWMSQKGFVAMDDEGQVKLTPRGKEVYDNLVQWIIQHVGLMKLPRIRGSEE
jgi:predicted transcriptional regulator